MKQKYCKTLGSHIKYYDILYIELLYVFLAWWWLIYRPKHVVFK